MYHIFLIVQKLAATFELLFIIIILWTMLQYMRKRDN